MKRLTHRSPAPPVDGSRLLCGVAAFLLVALVARLASADRAPRSGTTIEAGGAIAEVWHTYSDDPRSLTFIGHVGVGAFVHPKVAILLRFAVLTAGQPMSATTHFGADVQWWPTTSLFVAAGGGAAYWYPLNRDTDRDPMAGVGATVRAGWVLVGTQKNCLRLGVEALPTWFRGGHSSTAVGLVIDWQRF